jgi:hypothetical protein
MHLLCSLSDYTPAEKASSGITQLFRHINKQDLLTGIQKLNQMLQGSDTTDWKLHGFVTTFG